MSFKIWEEKRRNIAGKLISNLLESCDEGGGFKDYHGYQIWTRALKALANPGTFPIYYLQILTAMKKEGLKSVEAFEKKTAACGEPPAAFPNPSKPFVFFIPIKLKTGGGANLHKPIRVLGQQFRFVTRESLQKEFGNQELQELLAKNGKHPERLPETFIRVEGIGANWGTAWDSVESAFDTFRGLLELTHSFGLTTHSSGKPRPRNKFGCPQWLASISPDCRIEFVSFQTDDDDEGWQAKEVTKDEHVTFLKNCAHFKTIPADRSTMRVLANALSLYVQALDVTLNHRRLLCFWQMAEALVLSQGFNGDTKTVCARLALFPQWRSKHSDGLREALVEIAEKRNDIVHRGQQAGANDDDINILKLSCETALQWLWGHRQSLLSESHLEFFYKFRGLNNVDLKKATTEAGIARQVVRFVLKDR